MVSYLFSKLQFETLKYSFYDALAVNFPTQKVSDKIVLVQLTDKTQKKHDHLIPLSVHQSVIDSILSQNPKKLVIHPDGDNRFFYRDEKKRLAEFMQAQDKEKVTFAINDLFTDKPTQSEEISIEFEDVQHASSHA